MRYERSLKTTPLSELSRRTPVIQVLIGPRQVGKTTIEVKSGRSGKAAGLTRFRQRYPEARALLVGGPGIPLAEFFSRDPRAWLAK